MTTLLPLVATFLLAANWNQTVLHRAMSDELARNMDSLALAAAERPYYLEYRVREWDRVVVRGEFGALVENREDGGRLVWVDLRVGSPEFDNTNYLAPGGTVGALSVRLPLDDDYGALRDALWLATDLAYKRALEDLARKRAYAENRTVEDYPGDLSPAEATHVLQEEAEVLGDRQHWQELVVELSEIFTQHPQVQESGASLAAQATNQHFLNSEGSRHVRGSSGVVLTAVAYGQCSDGMKVGDRVVALWDFDEEPPLAELRGRMEKLAHRVSDLSGATRGENYVGPILFTGPAGGEFWVQTLLENLSSPRTPLGSASLGSNVNEAVLVRRLHRRILPQGFDVADDPTLSSFGAQNLLGTYSVDDDGVKPHRVHLVEAGRLVDLPMSRIPTKEITGSNGHGRGSGRWVDGQPSNTIVSDTNGVPREALLDQLEELCTASQLSYGYVVEVVSPSWWADAGPSAWYRSSWPYRGPAPTSMLGDPIVAYRVWFEDGRWELVRGLEFTDVTIRSLKDIVASGESPHVHHYLTGPRGGLPDLPATIVAPPVLLEEAELKRKELEETTLPYLPHPSFE